ncbi:hypothetical protein GKQ38_03295 [Candidatus Nanohaloarchaea archaeon]|nr:hypothetical protein GKQ38_03295 [Candidatus Nanohaloarchaea archaeon]
MAWYALQEIEEAAKRTRELLLPFDWKLWAKIAVMAFFVGGVAFPGASPGGSFSDSDDFDAGQDIISGSDIGQSGIYGFSTAAIILIALAAAIGIGLVFGLLKAVFSFVYYQSLLDDEIRIRENFRKHLFNGLHLFTFEIAVIIAFIAAAGLLVLPLAITPLSLIVTLPLAVVFVIAAVVFFQFTADFIPLFMIEKEQGVIASWRDLYQVAIDEWRQLGLYFVVKMVIGLMVQIAIGTASLLFVLLLIIPVGLLAFVMYLIFKPLALVAVLIGLLIWVGGIVYFLNGPAVTFFRYYSLLVYNDLTQAENVEKE